MSDGDTITVLDATNQQHKIRLAEIDAPERGQPWGDRLKQALSALVFGKMVSVQQTDTDRYGRVVARVLVMAKTSIVRWSNTGMLGRTVSISRMTRCLRLKRVRVVSAVVCGR